MARLLYHDFQQFRRRMYWLPLAIFYVFGLLNGGYLFLRADESFVSMMYRAASCRVSIAGLAAVIFLPFLFSAFAVSLRRPWLLWLVVYGKALCFAYVALGILAAYGRGGWLALPLLMFSDVFTIPVLWVYWLRSSASEGSRLVPICWMWLMFIGSLDYFIISPFVASL